MYALGATTLPPPPYSHMYFIDGLLAEYDQVKFPLFSKNSASFPVMCYIIDFIDISHTAYCS